MIIHFVPVANINHRGLAHNPWGEQKNGPEVVAPAFINFSRHARANVAKSIQQSQYLLLSQKNQNNMQLINGKIMYYINLLLILLDKT